MCVCIGGGEGGGGLLEKQQGAGCCVVGFYRPPPEQMLNNNEVWHCWDSNLQRFLEAFRPSRSFSSTTSHSLWSQVLIWGCGCWILSEHFGWHKAHSNTPVTR